MVVAISTSTWADETLRSIDTTAATFARPPTPANGTQDAEPLPDALPRRPAARKPIQPLLLRRLVHPATPNQSGMSTPTTPIFGSPTRPTFDPYAVFGTPRSPTYRSCSRNPTIISVASSLTYVDIIDKWSSESDESIEKDKQKHGNQVPRRIFRKAKKFSHSLRKGIVAAFTRITTVTTANEDTTSDEASSDDNVASQEEERDDSDSISIVSVASSGFFDSYIESRRAKLARVPEDPKTLSQYERAGSWLVDWERLHQKLFECDVKDCAVHLPGVQYSYFDGSPHHEMRRRADNVPRIPRGLGRIYPSVDHE